MIDGPVRVVECGCLGHRTLHCNCQCEQFVERPRGWLLQQTLTNSVHTAPGSELIPDPLVQLSGGKLALGREFTQHRDVSSY